MSANQTTIDSLGQDGDAPLDLKAIQHRGFKWLMLVVFAIFNVITILALASAFQMGPLAWPLELWAGLLLAPLMGYRMLQIYRWAMRSRRLRQALAPGEVPCPRCGSLQTDLQEKKQDQQISNERICFACDQRWDRQDA